MSLNGFLKTIINHPTLAVVLFLGLNLCPELNNLVLEWVVDSDIWG